jgi:hypothetical protein
MQDITAIDPKLLEAKKVKTNWRQYVSQDTFRHCPDCKAEGIDSRTRGGFHRKTDLCAHHSAIRNLKLANKARWGTK